VQIDEEELFETCFRGYAAQVHAFALRRAEPEAAHDATGETFLIAWRRRAEMPTEPLPWLYGIPRPPPIWRLPTSVRSTPNATVFNQDTGAAAKQIAPPHTTARR
jgi:hypothetical protein